MKQKHTPGPWNIGINNGKYIVVPVPEDSATDIECGKNEANARLIASAPDLLAALEELCADKYLSDPINADRMANARAALAKARGEE